MNILKNNNIFRVMLQLFPEYRYKYQLFLFTICAIKNYFYSQKKLFLTTLFINLYYNLLSINNIINKPKYKLITYYYVICHSISKNN